jgi:streptogramin lyase
VEPPLEPLRRALDVVATDRERIHAAIVWELTRLTGCTCGMRFALALVALVLVVPIASAKPPPPPTQSAVVPTGQAPCGLAAYGGELWVGVYEAGVLLRLDRAGRVQRRHAVGRYACRVAVDGRAAWVTRDNGDEIVRIDLRTGRLKRIAVDSPFDIVRSSGSLWVTSFDAGIVTRLDPRSLRPTRVFRIGGNPTGIASCGGHVWVGHGREATWLTAIDPHTGRARRIDVVVLAPRAPRCLRGQLWVTTPESVLRVDPRTGELLGHLPLRGTTGESAAAQGAIEGHWTIWVTDKERSLVHRVDPSTGQLLDAFPAGPGAYSLARFAGSMWITSFAGSDVRRFDP